MNNSKCTPQTVQNKRHNTKDTMKNAQCTMNNAQYTVHNWRCTMRNVPDIDIDNVPDMYVYSYYSTCPALGHVT